MKKRKKKKPVGKPEPHNTLQKGKTKLLLELFVYFYNIFQQTLLDIGLIKYQSYCTM